MKLVNNLSSSHVSGSISRTIGLFTWGCSISQLWKEEDKFKSTYPLVHGERVESKRQFTWLTCRVNNWICWISPLQLANSARSKEQVVTLFIFSFSLLTKCAFMVKRIWKWKSKQILLKQSVSEKLEPVDTGGYLGYGLARINPSTAWKSNKRI